MVTIHCPRHISEWKTKNNNIFISVVLLLKMCRIIFALAINQFLHLILDNLLVAIRTRERWIINWKLIKVFYLGMLTQILLTYHSHITVGSADHLGFETCEVLSSLSQLISALNALVDRLTFYCPNAMICCNDMLKIINRNLIYHTHGSMWSLKLVVMFDIGFSELERN